MLYCGMFATMSSVSTYDIPVWFEN